MENVPNLFLQVIAIALFMSCLAKVPETVRQTPQTRGELHNIQRKRNLTTEENGSNIPSPKFVPGLNDLSDSHKKRKEELERVKKDNKLFILLRECAVQIMFVLVIALIANSNRDTDSFRQNTVTKDLFPFVIRGNTNKQVNIF